MNEIFNIEVNEVDGEKVLDLTMFGDIDIGGWFGEDYVQSSQVAQVLGQNKDAARIEVKINSGGGDMFGGLAIYNLLRTHGAQVTTRNMGLAGSAASIVLMAGHKIVMERGSMLMIHNPWAFAAGDATALRDTADVLDKAREGLIDIYRAKTGKTAAELRKMLDAETWLTADEAKKQGFADEIAEKPVKAAASVLINGVYFERDRVPGQLLALAGMSPQQPAQQSQPITREELASRASALLNQLIEEGKAAERTRLREIDDLAIVGHQELLAGAKYGESPMDAKSVAFAVWKAERAAGADRLIARRRESEPITNVRTAAPDQTEEAERASATKAMSNVINARRGGSSK